MKKQIAIYIEPELLRKIDIGVATGDIGYKNRTEYIIALIKSDFEKMEDSENLHISEQEDKPINKEIDKPTNKEIDESTSKQANEDSEEDLKMFSSMLNKNTEV